MLTFQHNCPYCRTRQIGFTGRFDWKLPREDSEKMLLATCNGCSGGVIFHLRLTRHSSEYGLEKAAGDLASNGIRILHNWPASVADDVPSDVPDPIQRLYSQALTCLTQEAWDAAGMTLRKAIDVSTKALNPASASKSLAARIDALYAGQKLTSDIKDWAHEVRLDGNNAAHEDESFTKDQATTLKEFVAAYMRYVYSLPALVERNRHKRVTKKEAK